MLLYSGRVCALSKPDDIITREDSPEGPADVLRVCALSKPDVIVTREDSEGPANVLMDDKVLMFKLGGEG